MTVHRSGECSGNREGAAASSPHIVERLGRYALLAPLGQGGMGTLHLAVAGGLGEFRKLVVLKELRRDLALDGGFLEMFMAEAKVAARMNHPNIVQTLEAAQEGERYFLAMEFLDGQPLNEVNKQAKLDPQVPFHLRLQILCELLAGLHYAHELCDFDDSPLQIVHRDVSPHNVFITYHGQVKVLDFGIAKAADIDHSTSAGVFKGRFAYAAPEQVMCRIVDRRADVFAVGVMLWEILASRRFAPGSVTETAVEARTAGSEPRVAQVAPDVAPELARICDRAIALDPEQRYETAEAFRLELLEYLLAHGALMQPAQIGELIRTKFSAKRAAMHRAIHAHGKHLLGDDLGGSFVRSLTSVSVTGAPQTSMPVTKPSARLERTRADSPLLALELAAPERVPPRAWWLLLPAAAACLGVYLWLREPFVSNVPTRAPLSAAAAGPKFAVQPVAPAVPAVTAWNLPVTPLPAAPPHGVRAARPRPSRRASVSASGSRAHNAAAPLHPAANRDAGAELGASVARASASAAARPLELGDDLRARRKAAPQRRIDLENPFQ